MIEALIVKLFAEENLPAIMTAVAGVVTIVGLIALWRSWK